ncbi:MAG: hypothetical protein JXA21_12290 [Anaerolineae bacterium]|nr:hypothetical protein [Anaerolineae bacterium]
MRLKAVRQLLIGVAGLAALAVFSLGLFLVLRASEPATQANRLLDLVTLIAAFGLSMILATTTVIRAFTRFAAAFYDLPPEKTMDVVSHLLFGSEMDLLSGRVLEVQQGHLDPNGPDILQKLGGPGLVRIAHDSAIITQRMARLHRVLGPGIHHLESFEKIWDIVDLRPQRRTLQIKFMTRDGIPASCDADIRFRIDGGHQEPSPQYPYPYLETAVLAVTTGKRSRDAEGQEAIQDWTQRIGGVLTGVIRNGLEQHPLDEFLNPRYWLPHSSTPHPEPLSLPTLEAQILTQVQQIGHQIGVDVESVQLGPVLPTEDAIPRQWLEFWQARMQRLVDESAIEGDAVYADLLLQAQVNAKVELITTMLGEVQDLNQAGMDVPGQLIVLSFIDMLRTAAESNPNVQQLMFQQAETLMRIARNTL